MLKVHPNTKNIKMRKVLLSRKIVHGTKQTALILSLTDWDKKVRISRYEGVERIAAIGASRANEDDDNFRQETVAKRGTIEAAALVMRPHLTSNNVSNGRKKRITRTFMIDVARIDTGEAIFTCTKQLGFSKTRGAVGW